MRTTFLLVLVTFACGAPLRGDQEHYLSDIPADVSLTHEQICPGGARSIHAEPAPG